MRYVEAGSRREDVGEGEESLKSGSKGSITQERDHVRYPTPSRS